MGRKIDVNDIVGSSFGNLTVLTYVGHRVKKGEQNRRAFYLCKCTCGKTVEIGRDMLLRGKRTSCGDCTHIEKEDDHYRYYCESGNSFIFDKGDLDVVNKYRWHLNNNGYPCTSLDGGSVLFSRLLLKLKSSDYADHVNGDRTDNRRQNLRVASINENNRNMALNSKNTTGYKGVSFFKNRNNYRAVIKKHGKQHHLGYFENPIEAARAYDEAARFYFGEFACVNFPRPGEQGCRRNQLAEQEERIAV